MAAAPMKSQPLHNFSFPFLKWNTTSSSAAAETATHDGAATTSTEPECDNININDSSNNNNVSETEFAQTRVLSGPSRVGSRSSRPHRSSFASFLQNPVARVRPRVLNQNDVVLNEDNNQTQGEKEEEEESEEDEDESEQKKQQEDLQAQKPWNLRPRKNNHNHCGAVVALPVVCREGKQRDREGNSMMRLRGSSAIATTEGVLEKGKENSCNDKNKKTKFWISLSREEIEEDVFIMTGNRPARRPKKRPKNVQKQLDFVFPGLWLVGATVDSYRVNDPPVKK